MNDALPPAPGGGRLARTLVEYRGKAAGGFTIRGPVTRREYRFAQSPPLRRQWVLRDDLARFRLLTDFEVHDEWAIDPEGDERRAVIRTVEDLKRQVAELQVVHIGSRPVPRGGRPRVPDQEAARAWHLHYHCGWPWRAVAEETGVNGYSPEAAVQARAARWAKRNAAEANSATCGFCLTEGCPPTNE